MPSPEQFVFFDPNRDAYKLKSSVDFGIIGRRILNITAILIACLILALCMSLFTHFYLADWITGDKRSHLTNVNAKSLVQLNNSFAEERENNAKLIKSLKNEFEDERADVRDRFRSYNHSNVNEIVKVDKKVDLWKSHVDNVIKNLSESHEKEVKHFKSEINSLKSKQESLEDENKTLQKKLNETTHLWKSRTERLNSTVEELTTCFRKKAEEVKHNLTRLHSTLTSLEEKIDDPGRMIHLLQPTMKMHLHDIATDLNNSLITQIAKLETKLSSELSSNLSHSALSTNDDLQRQFDSMTHAVLDLHNASVISLNSTFRLHSQNETARHQRTADVVGALSKDLTAVNASLMELWEGTVAGKLKALEKAISELAESNKKPVPRGAVQIDDAFYGFFPTPATFGNAELLCRAQNYTSLAEFKSKEQYDKVFTESQEKELSSWWIGATDVHSEGKFAWKHSGLPLTFNHWAPGEPNNYRHGDMGEDCVEVRVGTALWNDLPCTRSLSYICQYP